MLNNEPLPVTKDSEYRSAMKILVERCSKTLYSNQPYAVLGVFLSFLESARMIHHSHHWQTLGKEFYGDHLLFQRLYEGIGPEVDIIGEKVVGLGGLQMTNYHSRMICIQSFMDAVSQQDPELAMESLRAELMLLVSGEMIMDFLKDRELLTRGVEQALGNILDNHEGYIYLLQNRLSS